MRINQEEGSRSGPFREIGPKPSYCMAHRGMLVMLLASERAGPTAQHFRKALDRGRGPLWAQDQFPAVNVLPHVVFGLYIRVKGPRSFGLAAPFLGSVDAHSAVPRDLGHCWDQCSGHLIKGQDAFLATPDYKLAQIAYVRPRKSTLPPCHSLSHRSIFESGCQDGHAHQKVRNLNFALLVTNSQLA